MLPRSVLRVSVTRRASRAVPRSPSCTTLGDLTGFREIRGSKVKCNLHAARIRLACSRVPSLCAAWPSHPQTASRFAAIAEMSGCAKRDNLILLDLTADWRFLASESEYDLQSAELRKELSFHNLFSRRF
jgi:hypothetical protein